MDPPEHVRRAGQLAAQQIVAGVEVELVEHLAARVKANLIGHPAHRHGADLACLVDAQRLKLRFAVEHPADAGLERKGRDPRFGVYLRLFDLEDALLLVRLVAESNLDLGIAGRIEPLVEELAQGPAGMLFHHQPEVVGFDDFAVEALEVVLDGGPEYLVAQFAAQHVQPACPAGIEMAIVHVP